MDEATSARPLGRVRSRALRGIDAPEVIVETFLGGGLPGFSVVGLPETAVRESRERVKSAIRSSHFEFPGVHVIVNLAPADLPKEGGRFDLPIALSILAYTHAIPAKELDRFEVLGELSLYGDVRGVRGTLSAALAATAAGRELLVPADNASEAALAPGARVHPIRHLNDVVGVLRNRNAPAFAPIAAARDEPIATSLNQIRGQRAAKRALIIAAAGGHHLLMQGPPGAGKTLLANALSGLLPQLSAAEAIDVVRIYSAAGVTLSRSGDAEVAGLPRHRPFREPHHTASAVAIIGGGARRLPSPGEISLAHNGVLFLDEIPEFERRVIEALRQPLESGQVVIARASGRVTFPARFQLVAAMNPCPAGRACTRADCSCAPGARERYFNRLSAPILDRIDLRIDVPAVTHQELFASSSSTAESDCGTSASIRAVRDRQWLRAGCLNSALPLDVLERDCELDDASRRLISVAMDKGKLTARGCHRVMRVARTIADLDGESRVATTAIAEALSYRGSG